MLKRLSSIWDRLEATQPFTEDQAWTLFRIAAFSEAIGWTLLISGILINHYKLPGHNIAIPIAGQIHGTIFLVYFGVMVAIYTSLGWSRKKFVLAVLAGVPPYGSLIIEQWTAHHRRKAQFRNTILVALNHKA